LVGTTADFRAFGPRRSLPINHLLCENRRTAGRIGEDGLARSGEMRRRGMTRGESWLSKRARWSCRDNAGRHARLPGFLSSSRLIEKEICGEANV
jgi:hypothetical protein